MAATRACLIMALAFLFLHGAAAGTAEERRRQVQSLLRRLNKPPVASIQSPDGDIIDCVHISKQPAFDDPFLKNHTIQTYVSASRYHSMVLVTFQMRPSYYLGGLSNKSNITSHPISQTWHQNGKCPENTIPIRRTKEQDVLRSSSVSSYGKKSPKSIPKPIPIHDPEATCCSIFMAGSVLWNKNDYQFVASRHPVTETTQDFSLAQLWISAGSYSGNDLNTIEAGWQVYPAMYGDASTRFFIYWTRDAYQTTGCYNLGCSGFIQTNNQIAIGGSISPYSSYGGSQYEFDILIWKDPQSGNWWLQFGSYLLGYWPSSLFSYLAESASSVMWGGEVFSSNTGQTSTQMGSGHFPGEWFGKAGYIRKIQVVDSSNNLQSPSGLGLIAQWPNCYNVQNGTDNNWGTYIFYGGPGRNANCP
ncbi:hypothetical protein EJB05_29251, partial [Eragrostis curvula]